MTDHSDISEHRLEEIGEPPEGWTGGDLIHTGGNIYAREWIQSDRQLRVGYSVTSPTAVGVEQVRFEGAEEGDRSNPLMWTHAEDVRMEPCEGEEDCLQTAFRVMEELNVENR